MADEYTFYLDPDYSPDAGSAVKIFVKEGIGLTFDLIETEPEFALSIGSSFPLEGMSNFITDHSLFAFTLVIVHGPLVHTETVG